MYKGEFTDEDGIAIFNCNLTSACKSSKGAQHHTPQQNSPVHIEQHLE